MKTYQFIKHDSTIWIFFYDRTIKLWTVYEVDSDGHQISIEADHYQNSGLMFDDHGFKPSMSITK